MKMKKTWFSYLLWLFYTAITGILLATYITTVSINIWKLNRYMTTGVVCLFFAGTAGIWLAGRKILPYIMMQLPKDEHFANMWECFFAMCLFAAFILYRIYYILHTSDIQFGENIFYEMAMVTNMGSIPDITHGASYIYTAVLSTAFSFLGNKLIVGVMLQLIIQILAMGLLYFALRILAGRITALTVIAFMAFSPVWIRNICNLTPEGLYLLLYAAGLLGMGLYLRGLIKYGYRKGGSYVIFILLGVYAGVLTYLDIFGITLLFFAGIAFMAERVRTTDKCIKTGVQFTAITAGTLLGAAGLFVLDAAYSGQSFTNITKLWLEQYQESVNMRYLLAGPDTLPVIGIVICFMAAFAAIGFWMNKEQKTDVWILLLLVITIISITGIGQMDYSIFAALVWGVFAGLGLCSIGDSCKAEAELQFVTSEPTEEISEEAEDDGLEEIVIENMVQAAVTQAEVTQAEATQAEVTQAEEREEGKEEEEKPAVQYIENPLPLPKKHVKKEMDYAADVTGEQTDYDLHITENDDFDI